MDLSKYEVIKTNPYRVVRSKSPLMIFLDLNQGVFKVSEQKSSVVIEFWKIQKSTFENWPLIRGVFMREVFRTNYTV